MRRIFRLGLGLLGCATALTGCGDKDDSTGPRNVSREVAMQELAEISGEGGSLHEMQAAIALLALEQGADVQSVAVTVDGRTANFSMVGLALVLTDTVGSPWLEGAPVAVTDTTTLTFGWRGTSGSESVAAIAFSSNGGFDEPFSALTAMRRALSGPPSPGARLAFTKIGGAATGARVTAQASSAPFAQQLLSYAAGEREYVGFNASGAGSISITPLAGACDRSLAREPGFNGQFLPGDTVVACSRARLTQQYAATMMPFDGFDPFTGGARPAADTPPPIALRIARHSLGIPLLTGFLDGIDYGDDVGGFPPAAGAVAP